MVTAQAPWEQRLGQGQVVCWGGRLEKEKEPRKDVVSSKSSLSPLGSLGHRVVPSGDKEEAAFSTPTVTVGSHSELPETGSYPQVGRWGVGHLSWVRQLSQGMMVCW